MAIDTRFLPDELDFTVESILDTKKYTVVVLKCTGVVKEDSESILVSNYIFEQNADATSGGIGVQPFGAIFIPKEDEEGYVETALTGLTVRIDETIYSLNEVPAEVTVGTVLPFRGEGGLQ